MNDQENAKKELQFCLEYEICGSGWAGLLGIDWLQNLAIIYFRRKSKRKYARYVKYWKQDKNRY